MPCQRIESELDKTQSQPALKCGRVGGLCPGPREVLARMRALLYIRGQASLPPILYKSRATSEITTPTPLHWIGAEGTWKASARQLTASRTYGSNHPPQPSHC